MSTDFSSFIANERKRLNELKKDAIARQRKFNKTIEKEIVEIDRELEAISVYEAAKRGKSIGTASRAPRGERQSAIITAIKSSSSGLTRGDLLDALNAKGNKSAEQSVSNALSRMKKSGKINSQDGKYVLTA